MKEIIPPALILNKKSNLQGAVLFLNEGKGSYVPSFIFSYLVIAVSGSRIGVQPDGKGASTVGIQQIAHRDSGESFGCWSCHGRTGRNGDPEPVIRGLAAAGHSTVDDQVVMAEEPIGMIGLVFDFDILVQLAVFQELAFQGVEPEKLTDSMAAIVSLLSIWT